jgi:hypothetical protein
MRGNRDRCRDRDGEREKEQETEAERLGDGKEGTAEIVVAFCVRSMIDCSVCLLVSIFGLRV